MSCVVQVWWTPDAERPDRPGKFSLVEIPAAADFEQACILIDQGGFVAGVDLRVHRGDNPTERIVHARKPIAFRGAAILRAEPPDWTISEGFTE